MLCETPNIRQENSSVDEIPVQQLVLQVSIIFRVVNNLIHAFREVLYNTNPAANHVHDDYKLIAIKFFNRVNRGKKMNRVNRVN